MSFYENLLNQISVCPRCQGFGFLPLPPDVRNPKPCPDCGNAGVFLTKPDHITIFSLPTFLDIKKRSRISLLKKVYAVAFIALIIASVFFINTLISLKP